MQTNTLKFGFVSLGFFVVHRSRLFLCLDFFFGLFCSVFGIEFNFGPFFPNLIVCSYVFCFFFLLKKTTRFLSAVCKEPNQSCVQKKLKRNVEREKKTLVPMKSEKKSHNQKSAPNTTKFFLYSFEAWASNTFAKAKC